MEMSIFYEISLCSFFMFVVVFALLTFYPRLNGFFCLLRLLIHALYPFSIEKLERKPHQEPSFKIEMLRTINETLEPLTALIHTLRSTSKTRIHFLI